MKSRVFLAACLWLLTADAWAGAKMNFVGPKSRYAAVGLQSGDIVVSIDGIAPKTASDVGTLLAERVGDGRKHKIQIIRQRKEHQLVF